MSNEIKRINRKSELVSDAPDENKNIKRRCLMKIRALREDA